jgi:two-component system response regulator CpxR
MGATSSSSARKQRRPTVLVVDDSAEARDLLRENLETAGYEVIVAHDGRDALARLVDHATPELLIIDVIMPVMGGLELIEVLRSYRRLATIPVLVISGADVPQEKRFDNSRFLRKPIRRHELLDHVAELLAPR